MSPLMVSIVAAAAILLLIFVFFVIIIAKRFKDQKNLAELEKRNAAQAAKRERQRFFLKDESVSELTSPHAITIELMRKKYDSVRKILKIPHDAALVWRRIDIFCIKNCEVLHYCWCSSVNLYLFPKWASVEGSLVAGGIYNYRKGDENNLSTITIPKDSIEQWIQLPDKTIGFVYRMKKRGKLEKMQLEDTALPIFKDLMPEKEHSYVMKHVYPKSAHQIRAVKKEYQNLKIALKKGNISSEEFNELKNRIVLTM